VGVGVGSGGSGPMEQAVNVKTNAEMRKKISNVNINFAGRLANKLGGE
jgi:hypothetical protein